MSLNDTPFLGKEYAASDLADAAVAILPFPYEGGISYGGGTAQAPQAILDASAFLEIYEETSETEPWQLGIATLAAPRMDQDTDGLLQQLETLALPHLRSDRLLAILGGDHSITTGALRAMRQVHSSFSVLQIDAHADLRDTYNGSPFSHACTMARARELTPHVAQVGIRSLSPEEASLMAREALPVHTMLAYRSDPTRFYASLDALPDPLFITLDVDALDWSVVASTGTPEPGGFTWDEIVALLTTVFKRKRVVGFDVVELAARAGDNRSPFAVAKLVYKMIAFRFRDTLPSVSP